jgi:hypothetical protein
LGTVSYLANGDKAVAKEQVEVFSGGRVAFLDDFRSLKLIRGGKTYTNRSRWRQDKGHSREWQAFSEAILESGIPPISYEDLLGVTRATFAALESLRNDIVVKIE